MNFYSKPPMARVHIQGAAASEKAHQLPHGRGSEKWRLPSRDCQGVVARIAEPVSFRPCRVRERSYFAREPYARVRKIGRPILFS